MAALLYLWFPVYLASWLNMMVLVWEFISGMSCLGGFCLGNIPLEFLSGSSCLEHLVWGFTSGSFFLENLVWEVCP